MNRFSTIKFEIEAEFRLTAMDDIWVTFKQGKTKITKKKSAGEVEVDDKICKVTLTQEETASFVAYNSIAVQLRWINNGESDSSDVEFFQLGDVLEEGVIGV